MEISGLLCHLSYFTKNSNFSFTHRYVRPILESKGMGTIFQKKGKEMMKIWAKMY